jgi:hypothetical protein
LRAFAGLDGAQLAARSGGVAALTKRGSRHRPVERSYPNRFLYPRHDLIDLLHHPLAPARHPDDAGTCARVRAVARELAEPAVAIA